MHKVRWGLLSTAHINRRLIPAIRASARGELVAVASRSQASAEAYAARWQIPRAFGSYQAMLDSGEIDAVYISLPNHLHAEWTVRSLRAGIHVLCEKPFALTVAEVDAMIAAARESQRVLAEAFMYRHHPQIKLAGEMVRSGQLGEITALRSVFNFDIHGDPNAADNIRLAPDKGGGSLWDVGVYPISFVQFIMGGPPRQVFGAQWIGSTGVDEVFSAQMLYDGGVTAQISCSFRTPFYMEAQILGTRGRLTLDAPFLPGMDGNPYHAIFHGADGKRQDLSLPDFELYSGEVEDMHAAILEGAPIHVTAEETRNHVRTVLALYESAQRGDVVSL